MNLRRDLAPEVAHQQCHLPGDDRRTRPPNAFFANNSEATTVSTIASSEFVEIATRHTSNVRKAETAMPAVIRRSAGASRIRSVTGGMNHSRWPHAGHGASLFGEEGSMRTIAPQTVQRCSRPSGVRLEIGITQLPIAIRRS